MIQILNQSIASADLREFCAQSAVGVVFGLIVEKLLSVEGGMPQVLQARGLSVRLVLFARPPSGAVQKTVGSE